MTLKIADMSWFVVQALPNTALFYWIISYYSNDQQGEIAHEVEKQVQRSETGKLI